MSAVVGFPEESSDDDDFNHESSVGSRKYPVHDCCEFEDHESLKRLIFVRQDDSDDDISTASSSSSSVEDASSSSDDDDNDSTSMRRGKDAKMASGPGRNYGMETLSPEALEHEITVENGCNENAKEIKFVEDEEGKFLSNETEKAIVTSVDSNAVEATKAHQGSIIETEKKDVTEREAQDEKVEECRESKDQLFQVGGEKNPKATNGPTNNNCTPLSKESDEESKEKEINGSSMSISNTNNNLNSAKLSEPENLSKNGACDERTPSNESTGKMQNSMQTTPAPEKPAPEKESGEYRKEVQQQQQQQQYAMPKKKKTKKKKKSDSPHTTAHTI